MIYEYNSPLGKILIEHDSNAVLGIWLPGHRLYSAKLGQSHGVSEAADTVSRALDEYFAGREPERTGLPVSPGGTEFQRRVWQHISRIPWGESRSYGDIAKQLGQEMGCERMSAQAVGQAVGANPLAILVPCHRVLAARGGLGGYAGGLGAKCWLLRHEGLIVDIK